MKSIFDMNAKEIKDNFIYKEMFTKLKDLLVDKDFLFKLSYKEIIGLVEILYHEKDVEEFLQKGWVISGHTHDYNPHDILSYIIEIKDHERPVYYDWRNSKEEQKLLQILKISKDELDENVEQYINKSSEKVAI